MAANIVDSTAGVVALVDAINNASRKPLIFVDLEGINLSRHGSISIMQLLIPPVPIVSLMDIHTLGQAAFDTLGRSGKSLRSILESEEHPKVFFDVRNDSDALYSHFNINLRCIIDLQLVEFASRPGPSRLLKGLAKCINEAGRLTWSETQEWHRVKGAGQNLFAPERGGSYAVFNERPLSAVIQKYCVQDVMILPKLLLSYSDRLKPHMRAQIQAEAIRRVELSHSSSFNGKGRHMALGPSFYWHMNYSSSAPGFPNSILCSDELKVGCAMQDNTVEQREGNAPLDPSTASESTSVSSLPESPATDPEPDFLLGPVALGVTLGENADTTSDDEDGYGNRDNGDRYRLSDSDGDDRGYGSDKDFTACSASQCGYCGHCGY